MVETFLQPNFGTQDAASYKANIDRAIAVLAEIGKQFAPRPMATPAMGITIEQGHLPNGTSIAATNLTGIGVPTTNPRIDRIYYNPNTAVYERLVGTEAATPVVPAQTNPAVFPIAQILLTPGMTSIAKEVITDERPFITSWNFIQLMAFNFVSLLDATGLERILIGKPGVDHRVIVRHHANDGSSKLEGQQQNGTIRWSIFDNGAVLPGLFTLATLPTAATGLKGLRATISDGAAAPVFNAVAAAGGTTTTPVFCDGAAWRNG